MVSCDDDALKLIAFYYPSQYFSGFSDLFYLLFQITMMRPVVCALKVKYQQPLNCVLEVEMFVVVWAVDRLDPVRATNATNDRRV